MLCYETAENKDKRVLEIIEKCREAKSSEVKSQKWSEKCKIKWKVIQYKVQRSEIKWSERNKVKWNEAKWSVLWWRGGGGRDFIEKVYRSSKWWEVKDWGESVGELMIKKQLQETVHSTLLLGCLYFLYMYSNLSRMYCR